MTNPVLLRAIDRPVADLIDALVAAVDTNRTWEVERLRMALEAFDPTGLFTEELRLNGIPSTGTCDCGSEGWL